MNEIVQGRFHNNSQSIRAKSPYQTTMQLSQPPTGAPLDQLSIGSSPAEATETAKKNREDTIAISALLGFSAVLGVGFMTVGHHMDVTHFNQLAPAVANSPSGNHKLVVHQGFVELDGKRVQAGGKDVAMLTAPTWETETSTENPSRYAVGEAVNDRGEYVISSGNGIFVNGRWATDHNSSNTHPFNGSAAWRPSLVVSENDYGFFAQHRGDPSYDAVHRIGVGPGYNGSFEVSINNNGDWRAHGARADARGHVGRDDNAMARAAKVAAERRQAVASMPKAEWKMLYNVMVPEVQQAYRDLGLAPT